jgi:hypothetical protein
MPWTPLQDQTARASEAKLLETDLARSKEENAALKQQLNEAQLVEKERKKLAEKVERLESRVRDALSSCGYSGGRALMRLAFSTDERHDSGTRLGERGCTSRDVRRTVAQLRRTVRMQALRPLDRGWPC